jgi:EAL domain-containing protein (putative c-di-GMP-specific phosphodiesterase class I)/GGDEF domain-containing protein
MVMAGGAAVLVAGALWAVTVRTAGWRTSVAAPSCACGASVDGGLVLDRPEANLLRSDGGEAAGADAVFVAVLLIGRFAALRESLGYAISSRILEELASRVTRNMPSVVLGRVGRSKIEISFRERSVDVAETMLSRLASQLEDRLVVDDYVFELPITIGFATGGAGVIYDEAIDRAETGIAAAQAERVAVRYVGASATSRRDSSADLELVRDMPHAIKAGELTLHYQPKLNARTNDVTSAEALLRWDRRGFGFASTARFIQLAEDTGVIGELTEWAIARALTDQRTLRAHGLELEIHVNISAQLLSDAEFAADVLKILDGSEGKIGFEITETAVISNPEVALANLRIFQAAGITIAIDDYGSGLSSLAYLKELPAQELKIDQLFVRGLTSSHRDPLIIRSTIDLAHALEMEVTAEGVDDPLALSLLRVMGCDKLQGYQISKPLPLEALIAFLRDDAALERIANPPASMPWAQATA